MCINLPLFYKQDVNFFYHKTFIVVASRFSSETINQYTRKTFSTVDAIDTCRIESLNNIVLEQKIYQKFE